VTAAATPGATLPGPSYRGGLHSLTLNKGRGTQPASMAAMTDPQDSPEDVDATPTTVPAGALRAWLAAGVRHQVVMRILPVQRHDILGPLSVLRMSLQIAVRRVGDAASDPALLKERLAAADRQVADAVAAVSTMRCWDGAAAQRQPALVAIGHCVQWCNMALTLRGHRAAAPLQDDDLPSDETPGQVDAPAVHYAVLGLLLHLVDSLPSPHALSLHVGLSQLRVVATPLPTLDSPEAAIDVTPARQPRLDVKALGWLLAEQGWSLTVNGTGHPTDGDGARQYELSWPEPAALGV
jgi:hypothetical protein